MKLHSARSTKLDSSVYPWGGGLKLGSIYPRYVGPRLIIPGGILDVGYVRLAYTGVTNLTYPPIQCTPGIINLGPTYRGYIRPRFNVPPGVH